MFEDDIYIDLLDVLDGKPDYANSPLPELFARARCPPYPVFLRSCSGQGVWLRGGESSNRIFHTLLFLRFFFLLIISLVWLLGRICNGFLMVVWNYFFLFCVTTDAYWRILIRFGFLAYLCTKLSIFHPFYVCRLGEQLA